MYELIYSEKAVKQLEKLDTSIQERILANLERCRVRPHSLVKKLVGNPYFRLRVGDYRIILDIKDNTFVIFVIEMGHRKNIYD